VSYLNVSRYVSSGFAVGITGSINNIDRFVNERVGGSWDYEVTNPGDLKYYSVDADVKYSFLEMIGTSWFDPSLHLGGGYTWLGDKANGATVNGGLGITFWFTEQVGLQLKSTYKHSFDDRQERGMIDNLPAHVQHFAGLTFKFGGKDTDGDGIYDRDDACPEVAGLAQFNG